MLTKSKGDERLVFIVKVYTESDLTQPLYLIPIHSIPQLATYSFLLFWYFR